MKFSTMLVSLNSGTFLRVLSLIDSYGWNIYNSKFGVFISNNECKTLKEVVESSYIGIKFVTSRVVKVVKKLESEDKIKKYNTLYDPKALITKDGIEIFTTENGIKFKNLKKSEDCYETVELINLKERTIW